jgi:hypothetical protein
MPSRSPFDERDKHWHLEEGDVPRFEVELESTEAPRERRLALRRLLDDEGYPLGVVVFTPGEAATARQRGWSILEYVDAEGRVVYERD